MKPLSSFWDLVHYLQVIKGRVFSSLVFAHVFTFKPNFWHFPLHRYHQLFPFSQLQFVGKAGFKPNHHSLQVESFTPKLLRLDKQKRASYLIGLLINGNLVQLMWKHFILKLQCVDKHHQNYVNFDLYLSSTLLGRENS